MRARVRPETLLFAAAAVLAIVWFGSGIAAPPLTAQVLVLGGLAAVLGLPHGALDPLIARRIGMWRSAPGFATFNLVYLASVAGVIGLWLLAPVPSLVVFLVISAAHFGSDWNTRSPWWMRVTTGVSLLSLPAVGHTTEVAALYETLASGGGAVASAQAVTGVVALVGMTVAAVVAARSRVSDGVEIILVAALALVAPPLVFFAIYFCALHSARHLREGFREERGAGRVAIAVTIVYTVVPIVAVAVFLAVGQIGPAFDAALLRIVFIGLAGLTVPHMILVALSERRARAGGRGVVRAGGRRDIRSR